jgi:hypothetical protein
LENRRASPDSGSSLPKLGVSGFQVKFQPPDTTAATIAATAMPRPNGASTASRRCACSDSDSSIGCDELSAPASKRRPSASSRPAACVAAGASTTSAATPITIGSKWPRSRERAT